MHACSTGECVPDVDLHESARSTAHVHHSPSEFETRAAHLPCSHPVFAELGSNTCVENSLINSEAE